MPPAVVIKKETVRKWGQKTQPKRAARSIHPTNFGSRGLFALASHMERVTGMPATVPNKTGASKFI